jgi:plasmid maintenance system antidote protein VapI
MRQINEIDRRIIAKRVAAISGADRMKELLASRGLTVTGAAKRMRVDRTQLSRCLSGRRMDPQMRDKLARLLGRPRAFVDRTLDE